MLVLLHDSSTPHDVQIFIKSKIWKSTKESISLSLSIVSWPWSVVDLLFVFNFEKRGEGRKRVLKESLLYKHEH